MKYYFGTLLVIISLLSISSPAAAEVQIDLLGIFGTIFNPPHRQAQIKAQADIAREKAIQQTEIQKARDTAKQNADSVTPILTKWGVKRVNCAPGGVFINGLSIDTICVNPTDLIPVGYYNYIADRQLLIRLEPKNLPEPTAATATTNRNRDRDQGF